MRTHITAIAAGLLLVGCSSGSEAAGEQPGSPAVYDRIAGLEDCAALQQEFDTTAATSDRADAGTPEAKAALGYMEAADERLKELDCY